ncbi:MAG TPA: deoxyribonuclease I [Deltaproteobacteria bacterium]|nr:deoxyribonuclease I [Deltaproteobacteria bacterium]
MRLFPPRTVIPGFLLLMGLSLTSCLGDLEVGQDEISEPGRATEPPKPTDPVPNPFDPPQPAPSSEPPPKPAELPKTAGSFQTAKRWLYEKVHVEHRRTLYCGCSFDEDNNIDLASCGLQALESEARAKRVEAEHVVPAARIGSQLPCWTEPLCKRSSGQPFKGRSCCEQIDPWFETAHNDLHNLYPAVGQINAKRSDRDYGEVPGEERAFGSCDFEIDSKHAEPKESVRGEIARTYLYMRDTYGLVLSEEESARYQRWNTSDPPEAWEIDRNNRIEEAQGNRNPYITP